MKKIIPFLIVGLSAVLLYSCGLKEIKIIDKTDDGDKQFARAEKRFEQADYAKALSEYNAYIQNYPSGSMVPAALMKIGAILTSRGEYDQARKAYLYLAGKYPESTYTPDGLVDVMVTYYREGRYDDVIRHSYDVPEDRVPRDYLIRKYALIGDAFMMLGSPGDAVDAYVQAYTRSDSSERDGMSIKLKKALDRFTPEELASLLSRTPDDEIRAFIEFQQCRNVLKEGRKDEGLEALTRFIQKYFRHPLAQDAEKIKEDLTSSVYQQNLVGCLLPTSGKYEAYGNQAQKGFDLAFNRMLTEHEDLNLKVVYRDTESDPQRAREAVQELAELGVCAIVGPVGNVEEAAREAQVRGIPIMTLSGKEDITRIGDFVFRNFLTREMQVKSVVSYAFEVLGLNNFAILYPDEQYGKDMMRLFWNEVETYGGSIVGVERYGLDNVDFATHIKKLTGMHYPVPATPEEALSEGDGNGDGGGQIPENPVVDFDALFIPDSTEKVGLILPQLTFYDVGDVYLLGTNLWHTEELIEMAGKNAEGTIIPDGFYAGSQKPEVKRFVSEYKEVFNETPGFIEAIAYDSAMMIFQVVLESPLSYGLFRDRLLAIHDFHGVTGTTSVDETGDVWKSLYLLNASEKGFRELTQ